MQAMTLEQIKVMVDAIELKKEKAIAAGGQMEHCSTVRPTITRRHNGGYSIVFDTPVGDVLLRSARRDDRRFASIDSAMDAINECGIGFAQVIRSVVPKDFDRDI